MRKLGFIMLAAALTAGVVSAVDVEGDIGLYSQYVWRGMNLDSKPAMQGGLTVSQSGFYANIWGNYSLSDDYVGVGNDELNELDYTVGYAGAVGVVDYDVGVIYYTFPNTALDNTQEIYVGLALNNLPVTPSIYAYFDVHEADGFYAVADLNYGKELSDALSMELGASAAYGDKNYHNFYYGKNKGGLSDMSVYAGLSYALTENLSLNGLLACTFYPDGAMADTAENVYVHDQNLFGGVNLAFGF